MVHYSASRGKNGDFSAFGRYLRRQSYYIEIMYSHFLQSPFTDPEINDLG